MFGTRSFGAFGHGMYWFYVLPLGFLLTMYTITGYDASAHVSEETHGASESAPKGVWRSVFYSAVIGWFLLLALTFAVQKAKISTISTAGFPAVAILETALSSAAAKAVLLISTIGQLFCGMACVTSASRMSFAFSRDGAIPGHRLWRRLGSNGTPTYAVLFVCVCALVITIPAYFPNAAGYPVAFFAVTSIAVIGLYIAYTIPMFLRWRMGDAFEPGPWTLGRQVQVDQPDRVRMGRAVRDHLLPADLSGRRVLQARLRLDAGQLRADRDDRGDAGGDDLVLRLGEAHVQGSGADDRVRRRRGDRRRPRCPACLTATLTSWSPPPRRCSRSSRARARPRSTRRSRAPGRPIRHGGRWPPPTGPAMLRALADAVATHREELAVLEARNAGKPIGDARGEIGMVVDVFAYYAGAPERLLGDTIPVAGGQALTVREPLGVVGLIVPWNFPLTIAAWKLGPALAAGNTVVLSRPS